MARKCPSCRRPMMRIIPLFGFGLSRVEGDDVDIPRRPTEGELYLLLMSKNITFYAVVDPFLSLMPNIHQPSASPPPNAVPPSALPPSAITTTSVRRKSGRQVVPNPRYQVEAGKIYLHSSCSTHSNINMPVLIRLLSEEHGQAGQVHRHRPHICQGQLRQEVHDWG